MRTVPKLYNTPPILNMRKSACIWSQFIWTKYNTVTCQIILLRVKNFSTWNVYFFSSFKEFNESLNNLAQLTISKLIG